MLPSRGHNEKLQPLFFIFLIALFPRLKISKINDFAGRTDIDRKRRLGFIDSEIPIVLIWLKSELSKKFSFPRTVGFLGG